MRFIYSLGIQLYSFIIRCLSPFNPKAKLWYTGRKQLNFNKLKQFEGCILIQCSSLGEYEQGKPLLNALRLKYPNKPIVLSFFSPSGYEAKKHIKEVDQVIYLPIDTPKKTKQFVEALKPEFAFFVKYDFWPNLYIALKQSGCKIYLISAIFRPDQAFFTWYGKWYQKTLKLVDFFFVQNTKSEELLKSIGLTNVMITGDTRFDQVLDIQQESFSNPVIDHFTLSAKQIVIAGSTWPKDEELILELTKKFPDWKWIIAPHEIHDNHIKDLKKLFKNVNYKTYTDSDQNTNFDNTQVLIADTIGFLKFLYRYGDIAYVGGGFGKGIHNTLEPAVYGIPILFGPKHHKFQEAQDLIAEKIGFEIKEETYFTTFEKVQESTERTRIKQNSGSYILKQKGAINKIMNYLT